MIAPVPAVPAGAVAVVNAVPVNAVPVTAGGRTAMLLPTASFPPNVLPTDTERSGCKSKVDCACCFPPNEFAMIDGQRFYLSLAPPRPLPGGKALPSPWYQLFQPLTDVIVAIDGVFVAVDNRLQESTPLSCFAPGREEAIQYFTYLLFAAVHRRKGLGAAATVPFVVLRRSAVGAAGYIARAHTVHALATASLHSSHCGVCTMCGAGAARNRRGSL